MNNDEEYDINGMLLFVKLLLTCLFLVKDSNDEVETQIETENKEIQTTQTSM